MRFKNYGRGIIQVPFQVWTPPKGQGDGHISLALCVEPGDITDEFDPEDPIVALMLKAHPELRPVVMRTAWQKVLDEIL